MLIQNTKFMRYSFADYEAIMNGTANPYLREKAGRTLDDVYKSYSSAKYRAYLYCVDLMHEYGGRDLIVFKGNCMTFSVGFIGYINGLKHFFYITRDHDRALPLEKMDKITGEVTSTLWA